MRKPKKHCQVGNYEHQIPMAINGRVRGIDFCVADIVASLNTSVQTETAMSCCGHGKLLPTIILADGRYIAVFKNKKEYEKFRLAQKNVEG